MIFAETPHPFLRQPTRAFAKLRRHPGGYLLERWDALASGSGDLVYQPQWFPRGELRTALGYAELHTGQLQAFDPDPRPHWITV